MKCHNAGKLRSSKMSVARCIRTANIIKRCSSMIPMPGEHGPHDLTIIIELIDGVGRTVRVFTNHFIHCIVPPGCALRQPVAIVYHTFPADSIAILKIGHKIIYCLIILGVALGIIAAIIFKYIFKDIVVLMILMCVSIDLSCHMYTH